MRPARIFKQYIRLLWKTLNRGQKNRAESAAGLGEVGAYTGAERDGLNKLRKFSDLSLLREATVWRTPKIVKKSKYVIKYLLNFNYVLGLSRNSVSFPGTLRAGMQSGRSAFDALCAP